MPIRSVIRELCILTIATAIPAAAVFFFLVPSHASVSSISGLSIVLTNFVPLSVSAITMILNVLLLVIGFYHLRLGVRIQDGLYVHSAPAAPCRSGASPAGLPVPDRRCRSGCGLLYIYGQRRPFILLNRNASSGGLDIVAKILNKYLRIDLGKAISGAGFCVALSSALAYDAKTVVLSLLGTYLNGIVLDHFIFDQKLKRRVCIVPPMRSRYETTSFTNCTAAPASTGRSGPTACRSIMRSSPSWTRANTRSGWPIWTRWARRLLLRSIRSAPCSTGPSHCRRDCSGGNKSGRTKKSGGLSLRRIKGRQGLPHYAGDPADLCFGQAAGFKNRIRDSASGAAGGAAKPSGTGYPGIHSRDSHGRLTCRPSPCTGHSAGQ